VYDVKRREINIAIEDGENVLPPLHLESRRGIVESGIIID
jgi:hypothetical protein